MRFAVGQRKTLLLFIFLSLFFVFSHTSALQTNWPDSPAGTSLDENSTLPVLIRYLYEWGIALGGLVAFVALIIAGFQYLTSMGDPTQMKEAMGRIRSAFFGIVLLLSSLLILNTINPDLTSLRGLEPLKVERLPDVVIPDLGEIDDPPKPCSKVKIYYTYREKEERVIVLDKSGQCKNVPVKGTEIIRSQAYALQENKEVPVPICGGILQFYVRRNCTRPVGTTLPPTNNPLIVGEEDVDGVMFIISK